MGDMPAAGDFSYGSLYCDCCRIKNYWKFAFVVSFVYDHYGDYGTAADDDAPYQTADDRQTNNGEQGSDNDANDFLLVVFRSYFYWCYFQLNLYTSFSSFSSHYYE